MPEAVICSAVRSPIGRAGKGSLREFRPDDLASQVVASALSRVPELDPTEIEDLILGCALAEGEQGSNLARLIAVQLGFDHLPGTTVNRYCASSLQSTRMAFHAIRAGEGSAYLSVGVECVSRLTSAAPDEKETRNPLYAAAEARTARRAETGEAWSDPREIGQLPDVYITMGQTAENVASLHGISRDEMDQFALMSQQRAERAADSGFWADEITPVRSVTGSLVGADDGPRRGTTLAGLAALEPAFRANGTVTAGNACPLNDGAAALVIMSDTRASDLGITPLARIVSTGVTGLSPEIMGMGPVEASRMALARAGMTIDDVDLIELNEAFAAQAIPSARELGADLDKVNVNGGAIAMGHPFGMTGARLTTTLIHSLQERDLTTGLATLCIGGGQGMAVVYERLS